MAVVDIDAHQGNGTAAIFYDRADVLYGSVHVDPGAGWFPHVVGYAEETGTGDGEGATRNLPLPEGTGDARLAGGRRPSSPSGSADCDALVVSLGVDAAADDPESPLLVTEDGYRAAGRLLGATGLPAVAVQEGGYHLPTLGGLVAAYLDGHAEPARSPFGLVVGPCSRSRCHRRRACVRSGTRVDVAWVVDADLGGLVPDHTEALALTPGGGRVGRLVQGALDDQLAERAAVGGRGRFFTLQVNDLEAAAAGLASGGTRPVPDGSRQRPARPSCGSGSSRASPWAWSSSWSTAPSPGPG